MILTVLNLCFPRNKTIKQNLEVKRGISNLINQNQIINVKILNVTRRPRKIRYQSINRLIFNQLITLRSNFQIFAQRKYASYFQHQAIKSLLINHQDYSVIKH